MRLGMDGRILAHPKNGISIYIINLVKHILNLEKEIEIFLFLNNKIHSCYESYLNSERIKKIIFASSKDKKRKWSQIYLPSKLNEYKIDIYHATSNTAVPFFRNCPCVLTIHDLSPWILNMHFKDRRKALKYKLKHAGCAHIADLILTVSKKSKEDILKLCKIRRKKIKVTHLGLDREFIIGQVEKNENKILREYNLENKRYLIDPAGIGHDRKNSMLVLKGFYDFLNKQNEDYYLVFTGGFDERKQKHEKFIKKIKELNLEDKVIITEWIPTGHFKILLKHAELSIIPSLYEGFGLPILESFACSTPVIASDRGAISEIASDAAVLVDPFNYKNLSNKIKNIVKDNIRSKKLIKRGNERLSNFNWEKTSRKTLRLYKNLL